MTALSGDRNTIEEMRRGARPQALAAVKAYAGALMMRNASGYLTKGATALNLVGAGRAEQLVDNSGGSAGDLSIQFKPGIFKFVNSASTDQITFADIGKVAWAVDDQTVAKTDGRTSGLPTRSAAGVIIDVDSVGVTVLVDEIITRAALDARRIFVPMRIATLVGSAVSRVMSPIAGKIIQINSITEGALSTGDATLTAKINGVAVTGGVITVTQVGSAAGDKDYANPTAANTVAEGDELSLTVGGTNATATVANVYFEIERL